jgi:hypothetical protein
MIYGENKPHKRSGNASGGETGIAREAEVPVQDTRDPDSSMRSEPFITDNCSTPDTSIPPPESVSVHDSDLESAFFELDVDSSSSIATESPLDRMVSVDVVDSSTSFTIESHLHRMGSFACTFADLMFDDDSMESFQSLEMVEEEEKNSPDESSSLGETSSYDTSNTEEIDWNGGLKWHEVKASINEISVEDLRCLGKVLAMKEEKKESSPNESTSLGETGGLNRHDNKAIISDSLGDLGSLGKVSISIQTGSVTTTRSSRKEYASQTNAKEESPIEAASKKVSTNFGITAKRKSLSLRLKKFLSSIEAASKKVSTNFGIIAKRKSLSLRLKKFLSKNKMGKF